MKATAKAEQMGAEKRLATEEIDEGFDFGLGESIVLIDRGRMEVVQAVAELSVWIRLCVNNHRTGNFGEGFSYARVENWRAIRTGSGQVVSEFRTSLEEGEVTVRVETDFDTSRTRVHVCNEVIFSTGLDYVEGSSEVLEQAGIDPRELLIDHLFGYAGDRSPQALLDRNAASLAAGKGRVGSRFAIDVEPGVDWRIQFSTDIGVERPRTRCLVRRFEGALP